MPWPSVLQPGRLVRRYNRFLADIQLDSGEAIVAHCVNTGRMEGLTAAGLRVWVSHTPSATRKLAYTWEITEVGGHLIGTNTAVPNALVGRLIAERALPGFADWKEYRAEAKYGENSRVDFLLRDAAGLHYLEVKNCHLIYPDRIGYFPDSVSERATKHLEELTHLVRAGHRASVLFTAQRTDVDAVRPSDAHDPAFAQAARRAAAAGVNFLALQIRPTPEHLIVERVIPADLAEYDAAPMRAWREAGRAAGPAWVTVKRAKE